MSYRGGVSGWSTRMLGPQRSAYGTIMMGPRRHPSVQTRAVHGAGRDPV